MNKKIIISSIIFFMLFSCSNQATTNQRVNPVPDEQKSPTPSFTLPPFNPEDFEVLKDPPPVDLSEFEFELEVKVNAPLPRMYLVEGSKIGEIKTPPAKYHLKGGKYGIVVFDLASNCHFGEIITLDKNKTIEYGLDDFCL